MWIDRKAAKSVIELMGIFPVVAILGPRQCGKSSLAKHLLKGVENSITLDLERPSDLRKLDDPEMFFEANRDMVVCLDEIQRFPDLFPVLRSEVDAKRSPGRFLILGSASKELLKQSSESLAGRIAYYELTPFIYSEVVDGIDGMDGMRHLWSRGGFPDSFLSSTDRSSILWRQNFLKTLIERDLPMLGFKGDSNRLSKLLMLLAHEQGQLVNYAKMGQAIDMTGQSVRNYIELLCSTFLISILLPKISNIKKRIVKSHKIYFRDQGIFHAVLRVDDFNDLLGSPYAGASWEGVAIEQIVSARDDFQHSFYRSAGGAEIDLILEKRNKRIAVEFKSSKTPKLSKGFHIAADDLEITDKWVVIPSEGVYPISGAKVAGLGDFLQYYMGL